MISSFNLAKLNRILKDFYTVTHIRITVFDTKFSEIASCPAGRASFCERIRTDPHALAACQECDRAACLRAARLHGQPYIYKCHAGLNEAIFPVEVGGIVAAYLLFGHIFSYPSRRNGWAAIREKCRGYQVDLPKLEQDCASLPMCSDEYIHACADMMQAVASYLVIERALSLRHEDLPVQIDTYLHGHLGAKISAGTICAEFGISRTKLYQISRESYGCGIADQIRKLRIEKAEELLTDRQDLSIDEVASAVGFDDYNYFITVFTRLTGMPPGRYRRTLHSR